MAAPQDLLSSLVEQIDQYVLILLDPEGRVRAWLMGATRTFGYESAEMLGATLDRLFTPDDIAKKVPQTELEAAERRGKGEDDRWLVRKDGARIWVTGLVQCLRDGEGRLLGFAKILQDRTDLKTQLDTLRARGEALKQEVDGKNLLMDTLAHELRNPLGVLTNAVGLIEHIQPDDARLLAPIQMLTRQIAYLKALTEDMLESARLRVGKVTLETRSHDLGSLLRRAIETSGASVRHRNQSIELVLPPVPIKLEGDGTRLQQVFVNLISNASKFSGEGARIWVSAMPENDYASVRVRDEGRGISAELLPHVFELFTQGAKHETSGSLGIGLSIVRQYVELHQGTVAVRSEGPGRGSEFIVHLPLQQESDHARVAQSLPPPTEAAR